MSNVEQIIEKLIIGMRDGKNVNDILERDPVYKDCYECEGTMSCWQDSCTGLTKEQAVSIAEHIVYDLYDGKFPIDHLSVGDICMDAFGCNPCIITNINERTIHVLYFNGKTYKFKKSQERYFKKLNRNVLLYLNKLLEIANCKAESSLRSLDQEKPGYDFPIAVSKDDAE